MEKMASCVARICVAVLLLWISLFPASQVSAVDGGGGGGGGGNLVNLQLLTPNGNITTGSAITVTVQAQCGDQSIDGIDVYIDFNSTLLAVQSAAPGSDLSTVLKAPEWDNTVGAFGFSAGQISDPYPSGTFTVVSITFLAKTTIGSTVIQFHYDSPRRTIADWGGSNITGGLTGLGIVITADAPLYLDPPTINSNGTNQTFNLDIKTNVSQSQSVSGIQAYINFDAAKLEVVDADPAQAGIQITPGTGLSTVLENVVNNTTGLASYSAGKLSDPFPTGVFSVASIQFRTKTVTADNTTPITISLSGASTTSIVDFGGTAIPGAHANASVQLIMGASVDLSVVLQGGARPDAGWEIPLTVKFFTPGVADLADVLNAAPIYAFNLAAAKKGNAAFVTVIGINPGTYDVSLVSPHSLVNVKRGIVVTVPSTNIDLGTLLEGNANDDISISIQDFGILAASYGKLSGASGFDARADFDCNGCVSISDFGLLASNYSKSSPQTVTTP